jgi:hypothetical protein
MSKELSTRRIPQEPNMPVETDGVLVPANYSFDAINKFVNCSDVNFEELQWALLDIATDYQRRSDLLRHAAKSMGCVEKLEVLETLDMPAEALVERWRVICGPLTRKDTP